MSQTVLSLQPVGMGTGEKNEAAEASGERDHGQVIQ